MPAMRGPVLDLRHLQMIRTIIQTGRVTDAAEELGLTPSALSHRIKEAERRLGVPLFERLHKRLRATPSSILLAEVGERIIKELELAEADVHRMHIGVDHIIRIAVEAYSSYHWLPSFLSYFHEREANIDIQVMAGLGSDPLAALANRQVDLAVHSGEQEYQDTRAYPLFEDPLVFITAPKHPLAKKPFLSGEDIEGESFITYTRVPEPDREYAKLFRAENRYPRWTATVELPEAIVELVAANQGTSVLANWAMQPHIASGRIKAIPVGEDGIIIPWNALVRSDEPEDSPIARTARHLQDWCKREGGF